MCIILKCINNHIESITFRTSFCVDFNIKFDWALLDNDAI